VRLISCPAKVEKLFDSHRFPPVKSHEKSTSEEMLRLSFYILK
jgi:hypothetical protein